MALDPGSGRRSVSPESSGRDSPIPRQWRNQLGGGELPTKDKAYRRYASGVDRVLSLFETALEEWADYISFLNKLLKALQARPSNITTIPSRAIVAKRLAQCLNPALPSGVHQKALEVYHYVFTVIGKDGLSRDLPLYLPGLAPTLSFASLSVRSPYLDLLEQHFLAVNPRSLRPAMKSIILALLPGLEDETSEDFDRTLRLVAGFKEAIRPTGCESLTQNHSLGDDYFWQCFFLASITSQSRRSGALAYLVRYLPALEQKEAPNHLNGADEEQASLKKKVSSIVTTPEPGLLIRCFATGLCDEQLLIQRGFLDLLVTHLPLNSSVLQDRVKPGDLEILLGAAAGVVTRRDMSLNRRLWAWLLGPEPVPADGDITSEASSAQRDQQTYFASKTSYFEEYGLQPLTRALLALIKGKEHASASERARPFRICLSLMDRWEIGGLVVPEVFLPVIESVRRFKDEASSKSDYTDVLRSASVFFDGIESGLIYGELVGLLAQAVGPGSLSLDKRLDKLSLVNFILANFNVREEEMITIHAPLTCLAALAMLEDAKGRQPTAGHSSRVFESVLEIVMALLDLVPERTFQAPEMQGNNGTPNIDILKRIKAFYVNEQGNIEASSPPFSSHEFGLLFLQKAVNFICDEESTDLLGDWSLRVRVLSLGLAKTPAAYHVDTQQLLKFLHRSLDQQERIPFTHFSSIVYLSTHLYSTERINMSELCGLVPSLVRHAWSFLSASEPRYHVESVRCLWQLQTALSPSNRDIEASISTILVEASAARGTAACAAAEIGRTFGVLWSHTLQDNPSDRRGSKTPLFEPRQLPRLSGMDNYELMLTQPLFLVLDALIDDRTQLHMAVKSWLNSMVGIDRLLLVFVNKLSELPFLKDTAKAGTQDAVLGEPIFFAEDDDLDLCLYYLRTLHHVLRYSGAVSWTVLASKHILITGSDVQISVGGGEEDEMTLQEFFVRVCMRCVTANLLPTATRDLVDRASHLCRFALTTLHQFFLSQYASPLSALHMDDVLLERLLRSINGPDPYVQILLLDVVYDALRLRDTPHIELPTSPGFEKKSIGADTMNSTRQSLTLSDSRPASSPPPPQLLKCLQAGLSSPSSRPVLDSWIGFFTECLPFYSDSVFQVLIPLVETLCKQVGLTFSNLRNTFLTSPQPVTGDSAIPESTLIHLLNGLEQVLARAHDQLLEEEARAQLMKGPDQPQSLFGSMVSGVFQADAPHSRSATANDRLTVHLAFQDAVRICYEIWSWGQGEEANKQDPTSLASFGHTSLRMRNRARRLLEHLFTAETLECLETIIDAWRGSKSTADRSNVFKFLSSLDASRPRHTIPALFNAIYSRANPTALDPSRKSTMTISLTDSDLVTFLVEYARSLDDDAMDEIWQDCMTFLKDLLSNPFPHRHTLPSLLEFAAILGEKVDNTNFGEQRRMRRELGDVFLRLLTALFTARPITFADSAASNGPSEKASKAELSRKNTLGAPGDSVDDVVLILSSIVPALSKILLEPDRVLSAANTISSNVIGPTVRAKTFPDTVTRSTMKLLHELARLQNNQKSWKKDVGEAFNDARFFGMNHALVKDDWLPLLSQWTLADKEKMTEIVGRISAPTTAGIVFGVGATSARLEADRKTQLSLRRIATLILASAEDAFVSDLGLIFDKLVELLAATATSSPSSTTRADVYMVIRALVLKNSAIHLAPLWPVVNAELHAAISSVVAPDHSSASDVYTNAGVLQACKLLDLLICVAPDDFQLHEWLFITDTIDAVHRSSSMQPVALADELSEELGNVANLPQTPHGADSVAHLVASSSRRRPLLGEGALNDDVGLERRDELIAKVLRPFFGQLSIFAFESTYAMGVLEWDTCAQALLRDVFDERSIVKAL